MGNEMIYISGLWLNESRDGGKKYMTGYMGKARIMIFKNDKKREGTSDPDYNLLIAPAPDAAQGDADSGTDDIPF